MVLAHDSGRGSRTLVSAIVLNGTPTLIFHTISELHGEIEAGPTSYADQHPFHFHTVFYISRHVYRPQKHDYTCHILLVCPSGSWMVTVQPGMCC